MIRLGFNGEFTKFYNIDEREISENDEAMLHNEGVEHHMNNIADEFEYSQSQDFNTDHPEF